MCRAVWIQLNCLWVMTRLITLVRFRSSWMVMRLITCCMYWSALDHQYMKHRYTIKYLCRDKPMPELFLIIISWVSVVSLFRCVKGLKPTEGRRSDFILHVDPSLQLLLNPTHQNNPLHLQRDESGVVELWWGDLWSPEADEYQGLHDNPQAGGRRREGKPESMLGHSELGNVLRGISHGCNHPLQLDLDWFWLVRMSDTID